MDKYEKKSPSVNFNKIKSILRNLISNVLKCTNTGGKVFVFVKDEENNVKFNITDNGAGIEPQRVEKIFKLSANKSMKGTSNKEGTSLGLLLCKEFIEKHKGEIWIECQVGKGTNIFFTLSNA